MNLCDAHKQYPFLQEDGEWGIHIVKCQRQAGHELVKKVQGAHKHMGYFIVDDITYTRIWTS